MTIWHIAWNYLWNRKLTTILTIVSVSLGVGLITSVLLLREETERRFVEEGQAFDIAVGAEGSSEQLVLSAVFFIGQPAGNIPYDVYTRLKADPDVSAAFPIALGDSFHGYRIVGTTTDLFNHDWTNRITGQARNTYKLVQGSEGGRFFEKPLEAVLGSEVAKTSGLRVGDTFISTHGLSSAAGVESHADSPYTVVGILQPSGTPNDRVVFCSLDSIWDVHQHEYGTSSLTGGASVSELANESVGNTNADADDHHDEHEEKEVTAVLIVLESPGMRFDFLRRISKELPNIVAAIPVVAIQTLYNQFLGPVRQVLLAIGYLVVVISSISILIGLYLSIIQRKRDLAIMRALGAAAGEIMGAVLIEAFWVTLLGIVAGWAVGTGLTYVLSGYLTDRYGFAISVFRPSPDMVSAYSAVLLMGMFAGIVPAIQAYRTDVARDLSEP